MLARTGDLSFLGGEDLRKASRNLWKFKKMGVNYAVLIWQGINETKKGRTYVLDSTAQLKCYSGKLQLEADEPIEKNGLFHTTQRWNHYHTGSHYYWVTNCPLVVS